MLTGMNLYIVAVLIGILGAIACGFIDHALTLREEERQARRAPECAASELITGQLTYVLAQPPETWTANYLKWLRLAFTQQHPHAVRGLQHVRVLCHDATRVILLCEPEANSFVAETWLWYVDRETGNFFQEA